MSLLKKYTDGDLSESELEIVSKELVIAHLDNKTRKEWEYKLKENYGVEKENRFSNSKKAILFSLVAVLLYYLFSISGTNNSSSNTFAELVNEEISNLNIMSDQSVIRKGENDTNITRQRASIAYVDKDYTASIKYWTILENSNTLNASDCFYLGTSYLLNSPSESKRAIEFLTKARGINKIVFSEEIDWVISLAYLKDNQTSNARIELSKIIAQNQYKAETAKIILDKLNHIE